MMAVVQKIGSFLLPNTPPGNKWRVVRSVGPGIGVQALQHARMSRGPVFPADFGLLYVLIEKHGGTKVLYRAEDDISELLV